MSTVVITGAVVLSLAFLAMFVFSRWRLRTIAMLLGGIAAVYVGGVAWFSKALNVALKRGDQPQQVAPIPHRVAEPDPYQVPTNGVGGPKTNAP